MTHPHNASKGSTARSAIVVLAKVVQCIWKVICTLQVKQLQHFLELGGTKSSFKGLLSILVILSGLMVGMLGELPGLSSIVLGYQVGLQVHESCLKGGIGEWRWHHMQGL